MHSGLLSLVDGAGDRHVMSIALTSCFFQITVLLLALIDCINFDFISCFSFRFL